MNVHRLALVCGTTCLFLTSGCAVPQTVSSLWKRPDVRDPYLQDRDTRGSDRRGSGVRERDAVDGLASRKPSRDGERSSVASRNATLPETLPELLDVAADHENADRLADAQRAYERILEIDPRQPYVYQRLGVIADKQRRYVDAERHYAQAISLAPTDANIRSDLGYSLLMQGRMEEAEGVLQDALQIEPGHRKAMFNLGTMYAHAGDRDLALKVFRAAGTETEARQALDQALASAPGRSPSAPATASSNKLKNPFQLTAAKEDDRYPNKATKKIAEDMERIMERNGQRPKAISAPSPRGEAGRGDPRLAGADERRRRTQELLRDTRVHPSLINDQFAKIDGTDPHGVRTPTAGSVVAGPMPGAPAGTPPTDPRIQMTGFEGTPNAAGAYGAAVPPGVRPADAVPTGYGPPGAPGHGGVPHGSPPHAGSVPATGIVPGAGAHYPATGSGAMIPAYGATAPAGVGTDGYPTSGNAIPGGAGSATGPTGRTTHYAADPHAAATRPAGAHPGGTGSVGGGHPAGAYAAPGTVASMGPQPFVRAGGAAVGGAPGAGTGAPGIVITPGTTATGSTTGTGGVATTTAPHPWGNGGGTVAPHAGDPRGATPATGAPAGRSANPTDAEIWAARMGLLAGSGQPFVPIASPAGPGVGAPHVAAPHVAPPIVAAPHAGSAPHVAGRVDGSGAPGSSNNPFGITATAPHTPNGTAPAPGGVAADPRWNPNAPSRPATGTGGPSVEQLEDVILRQEAELARQRLLLQQLQTGTPR